MTTTGNTAKAIPAPSPAEEPTMDEIMASIRQIISDDEADANGPHPRDLYTHPTDHSNSNAAGEEISAEATEEMEAELAGELERLVVDEMQQLQTSDNPATTNVTSGAAGQELAAEDLALEDPAARMPVVDNVHERAEEVRQQLGLSTARGAELTLEQRLEHYRVRARVREVQETVAQKDAEREAALKADRARLQTAGGEGSGQQVSVKQVAAQLWNTHAGAMAVELKTQMQPLVKRWLDDNLPTLVERLVREEIEKVSRGRKA